VVKGFEKANNHFSLVLHEESPSTIRAPNISLTSTPSFTALAKPSFFHKRIGED
jgi:hypothetical protein